MNGSFFRILACVISLFFLQYGCNQAEGQEKVNSRSSAFDGQGFAVVELFTSEGCSSCPPADELLAKMVARTRETGNRIFPIAFHVDYWDRLGWRDRFSSAEASVRQQRYAQTFHSQQVYTPQIVVNGRVEFVGSDSQRADKEINQAISRPVAGLVSLSIQTLAKNQVAIAYKVQPVIPGTVLNLVLVERGLMTRVATGENGGKILTHENVAREFRTVLLTVEQGQTVLTVPQGVNLANSAVIGFVQDKQTMEISACASLDLQKIGPN